MKLILSPTKTMEMGEPELLGNTPGVPEFKQEVICLIQALAPLDQAALKKLFKTSDALTLKVEQMIAGFDKAYSCPALFAFRGEAFKTIAPEDFTKEDIQYAQENLRILSGLYGALRPLDRIKPYRLDFNTPLKPDGTGLKTFWRKRLIPCFETLLAPDELLVNLASDEYASALSSKALKQRTVTFQFREEKDGKLKNLPVRAKQARGYVARHIIKNKVSDPESLKQATVDRYVYAPKMSSRLEWFFIR